MGEEGEVGEVISQRKKKKRKEKRHLGEEAVERRVCVREKKLQDF